MNDSSVVGEVYMPLTQGVSGDRVTEKKKWVCKVQPGLANYGLWSLSVWTHMCPNLRYEL